MTDWIDGFPGYISVCDSDGRILVMNERIAEYFAASGGKVLIGSSIYDCHQPASAEIIREQMNSQKTVVYTHLENGEKELVLHVPWFEDGRFAGLVEIALPYDGEIVQR